ncbi:MAG: glycoside hydrolase family 9 protein, partial [Actinomycetota bacterium]
SRRSGHERCRRRPGHRPSYPDLFDDELGITESGNGIPDIVDEVKWETDWLERMQLDDGSVLTKVGLLGFESEPIPSEAYRPRFYEEACSSATIAAAGMYANAALVYDQFPELSEDADRLRDRAVAAWDWYQSNPIEDDCDPQEVKAGDADLSAEVQEQAETLAAIYLFALTGGSTYHNRVIAEHDTMLPFDGEGFGHYGPDEADALIYYTTLADADPDVVESIEARIADLAEWSTLIGFDPGADLYRAFMPDYMYHWGSSRVKANSGAANLLVDDIDGGRERAQGHLQYFHGVNPLGLVYLSNMDDLGAERSAQHLFHHWFGERTQFDVNRFPEGPGVPPGFVLGGPNRGYSGQTEPPAAQPVQKSYADWAAYGGEPAWEITEPAIYYQSAYLRLLAGVLAN